MLIMILSLFILTILFTWLSKKMNTLAKYVEKIARNNELENIRANKFKAEDVLEEPDHIEDTIKAINDLRQTQEDRKAVESLINNL